MRDKAKGPALDLRSGQALFFRLTDMYFRAGNDGGASTSSFVPCVFSLSIEAQHEKSIQA
ncbi:MAG: hypothetical protein KKD25_00185 [Gammaproteobacteria bacterium]|nr:hypothetical protein [Gammaproteobacteria bacterium]MBU0773140.1 hypothetical protein [Gammaproteobacteria bacterium]MBU0855778.1 hypothetical protein [Gammaproteobacteria bacterium]MBU1846953.1 hypothetical protein [Gammaproteobacteria bacterium]